MTFILLSHTVPLFLIVVLFGGLSFPAKAANLSDFIERALELSGEQLIAAEQILESAQQGVVNAQKQLYPQISLTGNVELPYAEAATGNLSLDANYVVWDWGKGHARLEAERSSLERAEIELEDTKTRFAYDVAGLYVSTFYLENVLVNLEAAYLAIGENASYLADDSNFSSLNIDELAARENYLNLENRINSLEYQATLIRGDLFRLSNIEDDRLPLEAVTLADLPNQEMLDAQLATLINNHPQVLRTRAETRSTLASASAQEAAKLPEFFIEAGSEIAIDSRQTYKVGVGARFDIPLENSISASGESKVGVNRIEGNLSLNFPTFDSVDIGLSRSAAEQALKNEEAVAFNLQRDIAAAYQNFFGALGNARVIETQLRRFSLTLEDAQQQNAPPTTVIDLQMSVANLEASLILAELDIVQGHLGVLSDLATPLQDAIK